MTFSKQILNEFYSFLQKVFFFAVLLIFWVKANLVAFSQPTINTYRVIKS